MSKVSLYPTSGLTLIELLIAIVISSMMLFMVFNTLFVGLRGRQTAADTTSLQKTYTEIITDITDQARWATAVALDPTTRSIIIYQNNGNIITYQFSKPRLTKTISNQSPVTLNPNNIQITDFQIQPHSYSGTFQSFDITISLVNINNSKLTTTSTSTIAVRLNSIGTLN